MSQTPTIGRIVHYRLSEGDAAAIGKQRTETGATGNPVSAGDVYPAQIVRDFGGPSYNLQVALDGTDVYWATSRQEGTEDGRWFWPPRV